MFLDVDADVMGPIVDYFYSGDLKYEGQNQVKFNELVEFLELRIESRR